MEADIVTSLVIILGLIGGLYAFGSARRIKKWIGRNWSGFLGLAVVGVVAIAIGVVMFQEMHSETHEENMTGLVWNVEQVVKNEWVVDIMFTGIGYEFAYEGELPGYVAEHQYVNARFLFSPDGNEIMKFLGPADPPPIKIPPVMINLAIVLGAVAGIIIVGSVIVKLVKKSKEAKG